MSLFRFLPGIIIVQVATAILTVTAVAYGVTWIPVAGLFALILSLLLALWFASIADHVKKDALLEAKDIFARERERIIVTAEADKRTVVEESHQKIIKETNRAHARASFKLGAAFVGMLSVAAALLYMQLVTVGLLTLATAGGAVVGYVVRARQEVLRLKRRTAESVLEHSFGGEVIESKPPNRKRIRIAKKPIRK
ncbi:MAG: hypothetical protein ABFS02_06610 [Pseudomonadota bacterium]